jgi:hypothetical protein
MRNEGIVDNTFYNLPPGLRAIIQIRVKNELVHLDCGDRSPVGSSQR